MNLVDAARPAAERVRALSPDARVRVVAHYDPDGVASAAVAVKALQRLGRPFHVTYTYEHAPAYYEGLAAEPYDATLFLDLGATLVPTIRRIPGLNVILDHHAAPLSIRVPPGPDLFVVNPHDHGLDGGHDASGSTTTLAFALALDPRNEDLAPHALAGAFGDKQERGGWTGWNADVLRSGLRTGALGQRVHLAIEDGPLLDLLSHPEPPLEHLTDGFARPEAFLEAYGLPPLATPLELSPAEAEILASLIVTKLVRNGQPAFRIKEWFREIPVSPAHWGLPVPRVTSLLSAATREQDAGLGLAMLLGDLGARQELEELETQYHEKIRTALRRLALEEVRTLRGLHVFQVQEPAYTGVICGLAMEKVLPKTHATLAYSVAGDVVRISTRGTPELVRRGLNLAVAMERAASAHEGHGGGHAIASGASVPLPRFESFLKAADALVGHQLGGP